MDRLIEKLIGERFTVDPRGRQDKTVPERAIFYGLSASLPKKPEIRLSTNTTIQSPPVGAALQTSQSSSVRPISNKQSGINPIRPISKNTNMADHCCPVYDSTPNGVIGKPISGYVHEFNPVNLESSLANIPAEHVCSHVFGQLIRLSPFKARKLKMADSLLYSKAEHSRWLRHYPTIRRRLDPQDLPAVEVARS